MARRLGGIGLTAASLIVLGAAATAGVGCIIVHETRSGFADDRPAGIGRHHREWIEPLDPGLLRSGEGLRVLTESGDVRVIETDGPARIEIAASGRSAERLDRLRLSLRDRDGTLEVRPDWPDGRENDESFDLAIYVPRREGVRVETDAGDVEVEGMAGRLSVTTSAGDVSVDRHDGSVRVETSAGDVTGRRIAGDIEVETSAGDIVLERVGWPIEAITSAGDIHIAMLPGFGGVLHASTSAGELRLPRHPAVERRSIGPMASASVTLGDADGECVFRTSAGDVDIRVLTPENVTARVGGR